MNYEFHVGDYVETNTGTVGFISNSLKNGFPWWIPTKLSNADISDDLYTAGVEYAVVCPYKFGNFVRIGTYDFTKKEKKKIEPLEKDLPIEGKYKDKKVIVKQYLDDDYCTLIYNGKMIDKINELVDTVNKLMDKDDSE